MPPRVALERYADDTALVAMSGSTKLLIKYLETYLKWKIAINVDKSTAVLFSPPRRRIPNPVFLVFSARRSNVSKQPDIWG